MPIWSYIIVAVAAYLLGSIPTGFLVAKARGVDIRKIGSGNIGAANTFRVLGKPAGIFVLFVDAAKGCVACALVPPFIFNLYMDWLGRHFQGIYEFFQDRPADFQMNFFLLAGIFAVLGHNYTCWLKFKGGKGIATSAGVYLALAPVALVIALGVFILTVAVTRFASLSSILASAVLPFAVWFTNENWPLRIVTIMLSVLAIAKHRTNIQRLIAGTENQIEFGKRESRKK